jgi:hypothetical protein
MRTANRTSRAQRLQWVSAALLAGVLLFAGVALAQQYFTLTGHVPPAVAHGQAAWLDELPSTQRLSLAISLPLRHETELDDLLQRLDDPESPLRRGSLGFCTALMSAVLFTCWFFSSAASVKNRRPTRQVRATLAFVRPGERKRILRMEARRVSSCGEKRSTSYAGEES